MKNILNLLKEKGVDIGLLQKTIAINESVDYYNGLCNIYSKALTRAEFKELKNWVVD